MEYSDVFYGKLISYLKKSQANQYMVTIFTLECNFILSAVIQS